MVKKLFLFAALLLSISSMAYTPDFYVSGNGYMYGTSIGLGSDEVCFCRSQSGVMSGQVVIPATVSYNGRVYRVTEVDGYAFSNSPDVTSIVYGDNVRGVPREIYGPTQCDLTFGAGMCESPESCSYGNVGKIYVSSRNPYFYTDATNEILVRVSDQRVIGVSGNSSSLVFPEGIKIISHDVCYNRNLMNITLPQSLERLEGSAFGVCHISNVYIPENVVEIAYGAEEYPMHYFPFYTAPLQSISVSPLNPRYDSRDNCNAIIETATNMLLDGTRDATIPSSVRKIAPNALSSHNATELVLPDSITYIGDGAFEFTRLRTVHLPKMLEGRLAAFSDYHFDMDTVVIPERVNELCTNVFNWIHSTSNDNGALYLPSRVKSAYIEYPITVLSAIYNYSPKPYELTMYDRSETRKPTFTRIYIPKGSRNAYQVDMVEKVDYIPDAGLVFVEQKPNLWKQDSTVYDESQMALLNVYVSNMVRDGKYGEGWYGGSLRIEGDMYGEELTMPGSDERYFVWKVAQRRYNSWGDSIGYTLTGGARNSWLARQSRTFPAPADQVLPLVWQNSTTPNTGSTVAFYDLDSVLYYGVYTENALAGDTLGWLSSPALHHDYLDSVILVFNTQDVTMDGGNRNPAIEIWNGIRFEGYELRKIGENRYWAHVPVGSGGFKVRAYFEYGVPTLLSTWMTDSIVSLRVEQSGGQMSLVKTEDYMPYDLDVEIREDHMYLNWHEGPTQSAYTKVLLLHDNTIIDSALVTGTMHTFVSKSPSNMYVRVGLVSVDDSYTALSDTLWRETYLPAKIDCYFTISMRYAYSDELGWGDSQLTLRDGYDGYYCLSLNNGGQQQDTVIAYHGEPYTVRWYRSNTHAAECSFVVYNADGDVIHTINLGDVGPNPILTIQHPCDPIQPVGDVLIYLTPHALDVVSEDDIITVSVDDGNAENEYYMTALGDGRYEAHAMVQAETYRVRFSNEDTYFGWDEVNRTEFSNWQTSDFLCCSVGSAIESSNGVTIYQLLAAPTCNAAGEADVVVVPTGEAINAVGYPAPAKVLIDGRLYILRDGKKYDIMGN